MKPIFAFLTALLLAPLAVCGELVGETGVLIADGKACGLIYLEKGATRKARRLTTLDANQVIATVAGYFKTSPSNYQSKRSTANGRDLPAYLAHRRTTATLRELAAAFGLSHPDSVSNLIRRAQIAISASKSHKQDLRRIEELLQKP